MNLQAADLKGQIDFGIISIRDDEFKAVLQRFSKKAMIEGQRRYVLSECETINKNVYKIACVRSIRQGNITAQDVARDMIEDLAPNWLVVVGIAGGVPDDDFTLGDVVLASSLIDFTVGAVIGEETHRHEFAVGGGPMSREIENFLATLSAQNDDLGDWNSATAILMSTPKIDVSPKKFYGPDKWQEKVQKSLTRHFGIDGSITRGPVYTTGPIVSSDNLLKDPELVRQWQSSARHLLAVEMELAGIYAASRRKDRQYPILAVRGISDIVGFKRHGDWTTFACHSAASLAHALVRIEPVTPRGAGLNHKPPAPLPAKQSAYENYKKIFEQRLRRYCADVLKRETSIARSGDSSLAKLIEKLSEIDVTFSSATQSSKPVLSLIEIARNNNKVIVNGVAGGGKTVALLRCAADLLVTNKLPSVIIELSRREDLYKELKTAHDQGVKVKSLFDILLRGSIADISESTLASFPDEQFIMIDGLNELFGADQRRLILRVIQEYARKNGRARILITERQTEITPELENWEKVNLDLLTPSHVEERYASLNRQDEFDKLKKNPKVFQLLRIPFFLAFALESKDEDFGSATGAILDYFQNRVLQRVRQDVTGQQPLEDVDELAKTGFIAYEQNQSRSFSLSWFRTRVGKDIWKGLENAGAVELLGDDRARFSHQLLHDFLATRYLARNTRMWNGRSFDIVSFDSNSLVQPEAESFDPVSMTLEQIDQSRTDDFLKRVYDWNWVATISTLARARNVNKRSLSPRVELVMLAVTAEKHLDRVSRTRQRAERNFAQFSPEVSDVFRKAKTITKVQSLIKKRSTPALAKEQWFERWVDLFNRPPGSMLSESDLRQVIDKDPIIGWTASNVIRRCTLNENDFRQLRAFYNCLQSLSETIPEAPDWIDARQSTDWIDTVQWRLVHAIGSHPTSENADLLFSALGTTGFLWRQYGAGRSLVEMAALGDESLRRSIIAKLRVSAPTLHRKTKEEICHTAIYERPPDDWTESIHPLMVDILDSFKDPGDKLIIERITETFLKGTISNDGASEPTTN